VSACFHANKVFHSPSSWTTVIVALVVITTAIFFFKHKARKPDFELTKPSTGQAYNGSNNIKEEKQRNAGVTS
jgi:hypothetical protein